MRQGKVLRVWMGRPSRVAILLLAVSVPGWGQAPNLGPGSSPNEAMTNAVHDLQQQVSELRAAVAEMRAEAAQYRAETADLRRELQTIRAQSGPEQAAQPAGSYPAAVSSPEVAATAEAASQTERKAESIEQRVASLEDASQLLNSKLNDQFQTKVEGASKYRVRLSGIVLMNLFSNRGQTDNQDVPSYVTGPNEGDGNFGATLRQSEIGLEVFGPTLAGARTSANLQADFGGGSADTWNGVNSGIFRLRVASMRLDWQRTSVVVGQDDLFVSPLSPTSFASLIVPAFNYAGNLWAWTPQVRVEHRFDIADNQSIIVQGGILDNLSGEFPGGPYFRSPQAGENSGQPAYGFRTAWTKSLFGHPLTLGAAGYYSRQVWAFDHYSDGWSGMADWEIPLSNRVGFSGEFYRGRSVGGIGGGISRSVVYIGNPGDPATAVRGLDSVGGWSQFKIRANSKLEFNAGFGLDNPYRGQIRPAAPSQQYVGGLLVQNRSGMANFIYRPRSNLLFSTEYRYLQSLGLYRFNNSGDQINIMMGVLF
ncbi:MAG: hypothetical protein WB952_11770 [Terriglobales bacterium]